MGISYSSELSWLIEEFSKKSKEAKERISKFKMVKNIGSVDECKDVKDLEAVLKFEILMVERRRVNG